MRGEETEQVKVCVGLDPLWKAMTNLKSLLPTLIPTLVTEAETLQGDGGSGTIYHFKFGPGVPNMGYQKEKVVDFDESIHRIGLEVIEGGRLDAGFSFYKNTFQLTALGDAETLVDLEVEYETESPETSVPACGGLKSTVGFVRDLENFLLNPAALKD